MTVRRVVTGLDQEGRSVFLRDEIVSGTAMDEVWATDPALGWESTAPPTEPTPLEPAPGGTRFRVFDVPPDDVMRERMAALAAEIPGLEPDGFHTTETVDYVMVLEGEIGLELDTGEVLLRAGDCVVQRGTRHAWRNRTGRPVRMMAAMVSTRPRR